MTDNKTIQSIIANGGWCDIDPKRNHSFIDKRLGRIVFNGTDYLVIQRFDMAGEYADGFYSVPKSTFLKLHKAYWLKKYLSVGGKVIEEAKVPGVLTGKDWIEFINKLKETLEAVRVLTSEGVFYGYISTIDAEELRLQRIELPYLDTGISIKANAIQFIEVGTKAIREVSAQYRRLLSRG
jgi:hypothetical protein